MPVIKKSKDGGRYELSVRHDIHIPDPPCDWLGGCEHRSKCAKEKLACEAFFAYSRRPVANSISRSRARDRGNPTRKMYLKTIMEK